MSLKQMAQDLKYHSIKLFNRCFRHSNDVMKHDPIPEQFYA